jgi:hypothetical protein
MFGAFGDDLKFWRELSVAAIVWFAEHADK